ncbi:efflux RND transporter periplasmic adaptor subunit [Microvirga makkahensis]|uniref:Efflux RND transporter periplasmic adaptor subunit n=2 Tax=Microvirga makkahensis TaxID=1128670 RepID=A0A7X3MP36_9HYPH|nr:efflux RND transporter periplasmic adaptor subunit [Microvirga makkahensis]MXQ10629.1 efflux RND transporter periplasmic adaptor subunit [Microvirga makkahensis]
MKAVSRTRLLTSLGTASVILSGVALWALLGSTATRSSDTGPMPSATPATVAAIDRRDVSLWEEFSGRLEAIERVDLRPRIPGAIESIHFREGSLVRKGDLLFTIDPAPYLAEVEKAEAQVRAAEANLAFARSELERGLRMTANQTIAQRDLDTRLNNVREAEANVSAANAVAKAARLNLSYTEVRAPISGRVGKIEVTAGNLVDGGSGAPVLTTIVSTNPIYVSFDADERAVQRALETLPTGGDRRDHLARIPVEMRSGPDAEVVRGKLQLIDHTVNSASGTVRVRAVLDNGDDRLMPGQFARVRLGRAKTTPAVVVPERAIGVDQDKKYVLVVDPTHKAIYREIKLGAAVDGGRIVTSGLNPGERIVVDGLQKVRPGALIAPQPEAPEKSAALHTRGSSASTAN